MRKLKNLLLGSFAAIAAATVTPAAAQQQQKPNILIIWGDDIGQFNISAYNMGMMGYKTPNIDSIAQARRAIHRLVRPAELHRRPRGVHHRAVADPHRPHQGWPAGRAGGPEEGGPDTRRVAQAARLCDRPVRQEPPRRPQRHAADGSRLRRVSSAISTTSTPRRSRRTSTIRRTRRSRRGSARAACCTASRRTRTIRPSIRASARSANRSAKTPAR